MKHAHESALALAEKQLQYEKHLKRIDDILRNHRKREASSVRDIGRHKSRSAKLNNQRQNSLIEHENEKLLARLLDISQRKSLSFSNKLEYTPTAPSMNPYRKKMMKKIHDENEQLAQRLISKQSQFNPNRINKQIQEYQRIKRSMLRNKRPNLPLILKKQILDTSI